MSRKRAKLRRWPGEPMPEPSKLTEAQAKAVTEWFATLPDDELDYRQELAVAQMNIARNNPNQDLGIKAHESQFIVWKQLAAARGIKQCK